jgi:hypothetical protein
MDTLKYFIYKLLKLGFIIFAMALIYTACDSIFSEDKDPKKTWYWADQCLQNRITYRCWNENGKWFLELANDMKGDAMITYEIKGSNVNSYTQIIKSGSSSGNILVDSNEFPTLTIISVVMMKNGKPDYILECETE